jgi:hypothetical protein
MLESVTNPAQHGATRVRSRPAGHSHRRRLYAALGSGAVLAGALGYIGLVDRQRLLARRHPDVGWMDSAAPPLGKTPATRTCRGDCPDCDAGVDSGA